MVATRGAGPTSASKLKFKEKLNGSNDVLQKKLKTLYGELAMLEQGSVDTASLNAVRKELITAHLILHKDKGVKAHVACCLAEILRLYAPDAPYTAPELRDMFQFFFRQLAQNFKTGSPYYHQYFLLIESLSTVKSIVLVCDLPNSDELISILFREFFALIRPDDLGKNVEIYMSDMLVAVIDEAQTITNDTVKNILAQFLPDAPESAQRLASSVCNQTSDKLQRHVVQYFTDIMLSHAGANEDESEEEEHGLDFTAIRTAHNLIRSISLSAPSLLHNVIPQLETELRAEEVSLRSLATHTLGAMFSHPKTGSDLIKKYPTCWKAWSQRKVDKVPVVRVAWTEASKDFFYGPQELKEEIEGDIANKLLDPDEKVRAAACRIIGELDHDILMTNVSVGQLQAVGQRTMDKKHTVRREAMHTLGKIWSTAYSQTGDHSSAESSSLSWIPNLILHAVTHNVEAKQVAEDVVATYLLPLPSISKDPQDVLDSWMERLLMVWHDLDERATTNLLSLTPIKTVHPSIYDHFLQACLDNNGGVIDKDEEMVKRRLSQSIQVLSSMFGDPHKAAEDLYAFAKNNDQRQFRLMRTCMDPAVDVKTISKAQAEFIKRVEQTQSTLLTTMSAVLRRASFWIINTSMIGYFLQQIREYLDEGVSDQRDLDAILHIVKYVAKHCPKMLEGHAQDLSEAVAGMSSQEKKLGPLMTQESEIYLIALAGIGKGSKKGSPSDRTHTPLNANDPNALRAANYFIKKLSARHAKFAARILAYSDESRDTCAAIAHSMIGELGSIKDHELLESRVTVLAELARAVPEIFESESETLTDFLYKQVLLPPCELDDDTADDEWLADEDIPPLGRAKIQALKVCRNRCLSQPSSPTALDVFSPVLKLYLTLLRNDGSFSSDASEPKGIASLLRLHAASSIVLLSTVELYQKPIHSYFTDLALTIQDTCGDVRYKFLLKVITGLQQHKLHWNYNLVLFLTAVDPDHSTRDKARAYVSFAMKRLSQEARIANMEMIFIRLLHLLAHHPDFDINDSDGLKDFTKYLNFYLDLVSTADNLPLLYHLSMKIKTVRDADSEDHSQHFYVLGEMAQELIKARSKQHSWPLPSYPGKVKLPADIFKALPTPESANKILKHVYTPETVREWIAAEGSKTQHSPHPPKKRAHPTGNATSGDENEDAPSIPRKRKAKSAKPNSETKRKRGRPRKRVEVSEPEESSEVEDSDDEQVTSPSKAQRNGRTGSHRVKEESPPAQNDDGPETPKREGLRTRAGGARKSTKP